MSKGLIYKIVITVVVVGAIIISSYFYIQYRKTQKLLQNPTLVAAQETKSLTAKVFALMELPGGEDPTIATVSDTKKLAGQPFFVNSQNGDKVLIYSNAKKAILYRPSINKIIEVAPISTDVASQSSVPTTSITSVPTSTVLTTTTLTPAPVKKLTRVAIYNGTKTAGLAGSYATQLTDKFATIEVVKKDNSRGDYTSILVVDLTGTNSDMVKQIASNLKGKVGTIPADEVKPDADILVIIGQ
jgi:hypothetical protein